MAGNANSGNRQGGRTLTEKFQKAINRAIKQSESGLDNQKAFHELLGNLMQADVAKFMQVCGPYLPKEVFVDHSISIIAALDQARERLINPEIPSLQSEAGTNSLPLTIESEVVDVESE